MREQVKSGFALRRIGLERSSVGCESVKNVLRGISKEDSLGVDGGASKGTFLYHMELGAAHESLPALARNGVVDAPPGSGRVARPIAFGKR